jgi:hypothetical protein
MWIRSRKAGALVGASLLVTLSGCVQSIGLDPTPVSRNDGQPVKQQNFAEFTDVPIPGESKMDMDRTVVFGAPQGWIGRLSIQSSTHAARIFDFFKQRMPEYGWQEIASVRAATSFMTYDRDGRVMTIQIQSGTPLNLDKALVDMTVSPKGGSPVPQPVAQPASTPTAFNQPAVMMEPEGPLPPK